MKVGPGAHACLCRVLKRVFGFCFVRAGRPERTTEPDEERVTQETTHAYAC